MCPKKQQIRNNLIVKGYCLIIEIFDKFSFSGIPRGCYSHLNIGEIHCHKGKQNKWSKQIEFSAESNQFEKKN